MLAHRPIEPRDLLEALPGGDPVEAGRLATGRHRKVQGASRVHSALRDGIAFQVPIVGVAPRAFGPAHLLDPGSPFGKANRLRRGSRLGGLIARTVSR